jgi:hypothetical protein
MSGRPAALRQRDIAAVIRAAQKEGVGKIEVKIGAVPIVIHTTSTEGEAESVESNNSFDRIMGDK